MSQFYQQIAQIKIWIAKGQLGGKVVAMMKLNGIPKSSDMASAVSLKLSQWIERTRRQYRYQLTERENRMFEEACFVMVALADELMIIELDWAGKDDWQNVLLEFELFSSSSAGDRFYTNLERLVEEQSHDLLQQQLAAIYLLALQLGFSGRYRNKPQVIAKYRQKLFTIVNRGSKDISNPLFAEAYQHQLISYEEQRLAPLSSWYRWLIIGLAGYSFIGALVWTLLSW